jgi:hypothetical protein
MGPVGPQPPSTSKAIGIISETTQASREPALAGLLALSAREHGAAD